MKSVSLFSPKVKESLVLCSLLFIIILSMTQGVLDRLLGSVMFSKFCMEGMTYTLLTYAIFKKGFRGIRQPIVFIFPLVLVFLIGVIGNIVHHQFSTNGFVIYWRNILSYSLLFVSLSTLRVSAFVQKWIIFCLAILFIMQIPVGWVKYFAIGIDEKFWIGTMSQSAGQIGFLFPLVAISVLVPLYFRQNCLSTPILILIFSFFGILNEKRAVVFALPLFLITTGVVTLIVYANNMENIVCYRSKILKFFLHFKHQIGMIMILSFVIFISGISLIPSFSVNSHDKVGVIKALGYGRDYLTRNYESEMNKSPVAVNLNNNIQLGRLEFIRQTISFMNKQSISTILFGYGANVVSPSPWLGPRREDIFFEKFGFRGTYPSALETLYDAGYIGLGLALLFFIGIFRLIIDRLRNLCKKKLDCSLCLAILFIHMTACFDYWIYSTVFWSSGILSPLYFIVLAFINDENNSVVLSHSNTLFLQFGYFNNAPKY